MKHIKLFEDWVSEKIKDGVVTCDKCGWHWDIVQGGDDPYACHKCDTDNSPLTEKVILPKNLYIELGSSDAADYADTIIDLIKTAYAHIGGNLEFKNANDIKNGDVTYWILKDIDNEPDPEIALGGKPTKSGTKITVLSQDGSREAKKDVILKMIELMKTRGFYAELDKDLAQKLGLPLIRNEKRVRDVLQKDLEWHNDGSYTRVIGAAGKTKEKVLVGIPN